MNLIVAVDSNFGIGKNNDLLTFLPEDLQFFKKMTLEGTIIVGRKTLESFKNGKPLPKRKHIVLSKHLEYDHERVEMVRSVEELLQVVDLNDDSIFVAGGGMVYKTLLPYCDKAYVTMIEHDFDAEIFFPNLEENPNWTCQSSGDVIVEGDVKYRHTIWHNHNVIKPS